MRLFKSRLNLCDANPVLLLCVNIYIHQNRFLRKKYVVCSSSNQSHYFSVSFQINNIYDKFSFFGDILGVGTFHRKTLFIERTFHRYANFIDRTLHREDISSIGHFIDKTFHRQRRFSIDREDFFYE